MANNTDQMESQIQALVERARHAQSQIRHYDQSALYQLGQAVAWAVMEPSRNKALSEQAVKDTSLGNVADKVTKNHRKTLGLLRDLSRATTTGILREIPELGLTEIVGPVGVVAAVTPSTNPVATPINKIINSVCCGNAIIVSPSPKGCPVFDVLLEHIHAEFKKIGAPLDLVQAMPHPPSKEATRLLMRLVDFVVVTGSQNNVREAYSSGTPAIGVGTGNVTVIVDETADCNEAALKIRLSKTFDNATSCSSENNVICIKQNKDALVAAFEQQGGYFLNSEEQSKLQANLWKDGKLDTSLIAKDAQTLAKSCGLTVHQDTKFLIASCSEDMIASSPFSRERMAPVLSFYVADDFDAALDYTKQLLNVQGAGHSVGIHSQNSERVQQMALNLPTCRVIVNQAHCFATGGAFNNGMPFSLSMGCGSWGGNSISDNLNYRHYLNTTRIVREIPVDEPSVEDVLGDYIESYGE